MEQSRKFSVLIVLMAILIIVPPLVLPDPSGTVSPNLGVYGSRPGEHIMSASVLNPHFPVLYASAATFDPSPGDHALSAGAGGRRPGPATPAGIRERFFTGAATSDRLGYAVACAGDVNGDGFDDVVVGAPYNDAGGMDAGTVYLFLGGTATRTTPDLVLPGKAQNDRFGSAVACAGDLNRDGYDDIIVGVPYRTAAGGTGAAYVFFGDPLVGLRSEFVLLEGQTGGDEFGRSVAGAGDVNGDGWPDLIVGAWHNDAGGTDAGRAYIFYGGPSLDTSPDIIVTGSAQEDWLGYSVAGAGDVNGDGFGDVIVGAHGNDAGGFNAGRAYILFGEPGMDGKPDVVLTGNAALGVFGVCVAGAGDVNGDGYSDVIVGAERENNGGADAGRAYLFYGGSQMDAIPDAGYFGGAPGDLFGHVVAAAGDVDGDGYGDVLVSGNFNDAGGFNAGRVWLYFGGAPPADEIADVIFTGAAAEDLFGQSAAGAGDFNGDGLSDVIVGADYCDAGEPDGGRAYLYLNAFSGPDIPDVVFTGAGPGDQLGFALDGAGDVNGDGYDDMLVGAWSKYGSGPGYARIYLGGPALGGGPNVTMYGESPGKQFGVSVAGAGDVNGDGYDDVIIGADYYGGGDGRAYLYLGDPLMNATADVVLPSPTAAAHFGNDVASAGDIDGDGYDDVLVASLNPPVVRVYFGGEVMDNALDMTFAPPVAACATGAGDVNGDGYGDVIIGSPGDNLGGTHPGIGSVRIFYGGTWKDTTADVILIGEADGDGFGSSVAGAGDVNGDGYEDVIIGAPRSDAAGTEAGRAYIYWGGPGMGAHPNLVIDGSAVAENLGFSVAGCGDVNADGYGDVIVGAPSNGAGGKYAGRACVYFGGVWMDDQPDQISTGTEPIAEFGIEVAGTGDVNRDGRADILVGAVNGGNGGISIGYGKAFLHLSSGPPVVPRIMSVRDVPGDQGGYVRVRWVRSGYDTRDQNRITNYAVERSAPPGVSGYAWEEVGTVSAKNNPQYLFTARTWSDQSEQENGATFFRVTARSLYPGEYWKSNIAYGFSVDNLAPLSPQGASLTPLSDGRMRLSWKANRTDPDASHFAVYRSVYDGFHPTDSTFLLSRRDTVAIDSTTTQGTTYYYRITCVDIHGNESQPTAQLGGTVLSAEGKEAGVPLEHALLQNYPNPFNASTVVNYQLPVVGNVELAVYDLLGREVDVLVNEKMEPGMYSVTWNADGMGSGIYICRMRAGNFVQVMKMLLVR